MDQQAATLKKIMKTHPPYSINSIVTGVCVCFSVYIGLRIGFANKISAAFLESKATAAILEKSNSEKLVTAYETLCRFIVNDDLLTELYSVVIAVPDKLVLKDILESLIQNELLDHIGAESGTPSQLNQLCITLLNPVIGSFYDGTAGIGSTAIEAYVYAKDNGGKLEICTQEIDILCHALTVLRAFLYGVNSHQMHSGDVLIDPKHKLNEKLKTFDYSAMFPPLGLSWKDLYHQVIWDSHNRYMPNLPPTSSGDWLFVQHQLSILKENGKGIIALPTGALFNVATGGIRGVIIRSGFIECVITLPSGMLPYTNIPISLVIVSGTEKSDSRVLMIQAEGLFKNKRSLRVKGACGLDSQIIKEICGLYKKKEQRAGVSSYVDINIFEANDWILLPSRYIRSDVAETEYGKIVIENPAGDNWARLRDIGMFYRGLNVAPNTEINENGAYKIINLADVQNGEIRIDNLARYELKQNVNVQKYEVCQGDILISCKGTVIKICVVPPDCEQTLMSGNFIGISINQYEHNPYFVKYYLESPAGQFFLQSKQVGTSITTLTARDLEDIPIPILPIEMQNQYASELVDIETDIKNEIILLHNKSKQAKWEFYQKVGLNEIMKKGDSTDDE